MLKKIFTGSEVFFMVVGGLCLWGNDYFNLPILLRLGLGSFGATFSIMGMEAVITQEISFTSGRRYSETYGGLAAIAYGVIFGIIGLSLFGIAFIMQYSSGEEVFQRLVRHPGPLLLLLGVVFLLMAVVRLTGLAALQRGMKWTAVLSVLGYSLLPGLLLLILGLGALGLGFFEVLAPAAFDKLGGGFLESLFLGSPSP
jgi:hypothetical protein